MTKPAKQLLLIDNYDSFTYNLVQYFSELGAEVTVIRNDERSADMLFSSKVDGLVISPGPGDPDRAGICLDAIRLSAKENIPLFGVCLGHQALGQVYGGTVMRAPKPLHGKTSLIHHNNKSVFESLPDPFTATRYHSLLVDRDSIPDCLEITAETEDKLVMGLMHKELPQHSVQFHPESIATQHGHDLLMNFLNLL